MGLLPMNASTAPNPMAPSHLPALDNTLGAGLIGAFVSTLLQGGILHQTFRYYRLYPKDPLYLKLWVLVVLILEVFDTALAMHVTYTYMVTGYFNPLALGEKPLWSFTSIPIPGSLTAVIVELFFARRLWLVGPRFRVVAIVTALVNLACFSCYLALAISGYKAADLPEYLDHSYLASVASGLLALSSIMVTSCLIHILNTSRTSMKQTNSKIDFVVKYTVGTGLMICVFNALILAFAIAYPHNWVFASIAIVATKLYANSFLVALNTRDSLMGTEVFKMGHSTQFSSGVSNETTKSKSKSKITCLRLVRGPRPRTSMSAPTEGPHSDVQEQSGDVIELKQMSDSNPFGLTTDRFEPNRADVIDIKPLVVVGDIV